jgi:hypothetical protein
MEEGAAGILCRGSFESGEVGEVVGGGGIGYWVLVDLGGRRRAAYTSNETQGDSHTR